MKIKYEIEADSEGYVERVYLDGILRNESVHVATPIGAMRKSGKDYEDVFTGDGEEEIADALDDFMAFDLFLICNKESDE